MSLIWAIGFNENDASNVRDYSESNKDATTVANLTLAADASEPGGRYGIGNGASTDVEVTQGGGISYTDTFSIFTQFNVQVDADGYIYYRPDHSRIKYDAVTNAIIAQVWDNSGGSWLTSQTTKAVSINTWYKLALTYSDANGANLYLDVAANPDTDASAVDTLDTGAVTLFNDSAGGNFLNGWIRELLIFDGELTQSQVHNLMAHSQGVTLEINGHALNVGDLIQTFTPTDTVQACVFLSFTNAPRVRLISGTLAGGEVWSRVGHRWDTARQHLFLNKGSADPPQTLILDSVSKFSHLTDGNHISYQVSKDELLVAVDQTFSGDSTGLPFAEIYVNDANTTVTISGTGIANKVQVLVFDTNGCSHNMTPDHTNDHITVVKAGCYLCTVSITAASVSGAAAQFSFNLFKNNGATAFLNIHAHRDFSGGGGDVGSVSLSGIIDIAASDTIELWLWNDTNTQNIILDDINLSLVQVGGT